MEPKQALEILQKLTNAALSKGVITDIVTANQVAIALFTLDSIINPQIKVSPQESSEK